MGSTASSDNLRSLRLTFHGGRGIWLKEDENLYGAVLFSPAEYLRPGESIRLPVAYNMVLMIEFRAAVPGSGDARTLGIVRLPVQHVWGQCGQSLDKTWFSLSPSLAKISRLHSEINDEFDCGLQNTGQDPELVCLSLALATLPEAARDSETTPSVKSMCFDGLMSSHRLYTCVLPTLYSQVRVLGDMGKTQMAKLPAQSEIHPRRHRKDVAHVKAEMEIRISEANLRIDKASGFIRILNDQLKAQHAHHKRLARVISHLKNGAYQLEMEHQRMILQLEEQRRETRQRKDQCRQLHREVVVLKEQKEALDVILEDLYNYSTGDTSPA